MTPPLCCTSATPRCRSPPRHAGITAAESTGALYRRWYEVLAPHLSQTWEASEALLALFRQLWGQPFAAPTYALLLHQWLLVHAEAGEPDQRLKLLNVLCSGAAAGRVAGWGDGHGVCVLGCGGGQGRLLGWLCGTVAVQQQRQLQPRVSGTHARQDALCTAAPSRYARRAHIPAVCPMTCRALPLLQVPVSYFWVMWRRGGPPSSPSSPS